MHNRTLRHGCMLLVHVITYTFTGISQMLQQSDVGTEQLSKYRFREIEAQFKVEFNLLSNVHFVLGLGDER